MDDKKKSYLTEKEKSLLRDIYGLDTTRITEQESRSILSLNAQTKEQWKEITQEGERLWKKTIPPARAALRRLSERETKHKIQQRLKKAKTAVEKYLVGIATAPVYHSKKVLKKIHRQFNRSPQDIAEELKMLNELPEPLNEALNVQMVSRLQHLSLARFQIEQISDISTNLTLTYQF